MLWRAVVGAVLLAMALAFGFFYYLNSRGVPEAELRRRCAEAQPAWQSYQEDIKALIGAGPVAAWRGQPAGARFGTGRIVVLFDIEGDWAARDFLLPTLLRVPTGEVLRSTEGTPEGTRRAYVFETEPDAPRPAWAELLYPHETVRILPDADGTWRNAPPEL